MELKRIILKHVRKMLVAPSFTSFPPVFNWLVNVSTEENTILLRFCRKQNTSAVVFEQNRVDSTKNGVCVTVNIQWSRKRDFHLLGVYIYISSHLYLKTKAKQKIGNCCVMSNYKNRNEQHQIDNQFPSRRREEKKTIFQIWHVELTPSLLV